MNGELIPNGRQWFAFEGAESKALASIEDRLRLNHQAVMEAWEPIVAAMSINGRQADMSAALRSVSRLVTLHAAAERILASWTCELLLPSRSSAGEGVRRIEMCRMLETLKADCADTAKRVQAKAARLESRRSMSHNANPIL